MKLVHILSACVFAVAVGGCASGTTTPRVASNAVSTTQVTSAEVGEKNAPTPKVGKAQHGSLFAGEKSSTVKDERRSYEVLGDWK